MLVFVFRGDALVAFRAVICRMSRIRSGPASRQCQIFREDTEEFVVRYLLPAREKHENFTLQMALDKTPEDVKLLI